MCVLSLCSVCVLSLCSALSASTRRRTSGRPLCAFCAQSVLCAQCQYQEADQRPPSLCPPCALCAQSVLCAQYQEAVQRPPSVPSLCSVCALCPVPVPGGGPAAALCALSVLGLCSVPSASTRRWSSGRPLCPPCAQSVLCAQCQYQEAVQRPPSVDVSAAYRPLDTYDAEPRHLSGTATSCSTLSNSLQGKLYLPSTICVHCRAVSIPSLCAILDRHCVPYSIILDHCVPYSIVDTHVASLVCIS